MSSGNNRLYDRKERRYYRLIQGPDGEFSGVREFHEMLLSTSADVLRTGKRTRMYEPISEAGPPTPRLSSASDPPAPPSSSSSINTRELGAAIVSPRSLLEVNSRRTVVSSTGRGSTSHQLDPRAPAFSAAERSFGQHNYSGTIDISNATNAISEVTLCDSQAAKGHSDGYVGRPQDAERNPTRSTNAQYQTEVIFHGARIQRDYRAEPRVPLTRPGGRGAASGSRPYRQQDVINQPRRAPSSYHSDQSPVGPMTLNPNSSTVPDQTWQGPTLETLSLQGAGHPFEFSPQTSPFLAGQGSASQGVAVQYPQGNPNYQFSSRSGSQYIGNSQLNAKVSPVEWNTSIPSALSTGQSDRTNTSASHNRRHRKSSTGGRRGRGHSKTSISVGDETVDPNLSDELIRGTDGKIEPLDPRFQVIFKMLSAEPRGSLRPEGAVNTSVRSFDQEIFAKIYRYVVVKAKPKQHYSKCLRISTNSCRGAVKPGLDQNEHAIIYTGSEAPQKLDGETKMHKDPIQVIPVSQEHELHPLSRVNFGMTFPVQHNVKVLEVGMVAPGDLRRFLGYYQNEAEKDFARKS